ncbi:MAG: DUF2812 domain-containing protein [Clostridia bacterium]|nr:DUF2812 domain-containing protein [Clostridia bacterium]
MFKRNTNEKKKAFDFYYTELSALAEYLEKQENKGYRLKKVENKMLIFEKCEPRNIRYCVEIFKGSSYKEFIESCTLEGWEHVTTYNGELYIFRTQKSDAIDIMTDEKEKFKNTAKRAILQPGLWSTLFISLYPLSNLILGLNRGITIDVFETDVFNFVFLMFVALHIFILLLRFFDYFLWRYTIRKKGPDSSFFNLKNTVRKRKLYAVISSIFLMTLYLILWWIAPNCFDTAFEIILALVLLYCIYDGATISKLSFDKNERMKKAILTCVVVALFTGGAFLLKNFNEKYVIANSKTMLSLEEAPISVEDLNDKVKSCEDRCDVEGTRFGQLYSFTCDAERYDEDGDINNFISYNIFISDYPSVRQKYINKLLKEFDEYDCEKIIPPDTKWDYCYLINWNDENRYDGFAVKDNLIIYLRFSVDCKQNFFDVAYKELFDK